MSSATAGPAVPSPAPVRLTEAERTKLLESVERLIYKRVDSFGIPRDDRDDAASDCRLRLWEASANFDPTGSAKWSTFTQYVCDNVLKNLRTKSARENNRGGMPTVSFGDLRTPEVAGRDEEPRYSDEPDDDDGHVDALATAVRKQLASSALTSLSSGYRKLVEAVVIGRLSLAQISEQTGTPEKTLRTNLQLALGQLAKAGHVPAGMASALGFNAQDMAERVTPGAKGRKLKARRELIAEALAAGLTERQIIEQLGEPEGTVNRDLTRLKGGATLARQNLQTRVAELTRMGLTIPQIAADCGISQHAVYTHRIRAGIKTERPPMPKAIVERNQRAAERRAKVKQMAGEGKNTDQIAAALGIQPWAVHGDMLVLRKLAAKNGEPAPVLIASTREARRDERLAKAREMAGRGVSTKDIAAELGLSYSRVCQLLREAAVAG